MAISSRNTLLAALAFIAFQAQAVNVTVAYQTSAEPAKVAQADNTFAKESGATVDWRKFDSGASIVRALASGDVQIGNLGSSPLAVAASQQVPIEVFLLASKLGNSEALVVKKTISKPEDLIGKRIAVPFISTTHYSLLAALKHWGIKPGQVEIVNLQPPAIIAAWQRGDIDGAYVWAPAVNALEKDGKVLTDSEQVGQWGAPTLDVWVVRKDFAEKHPERRRPAPHVLRHTQPRDDLRKLYPALSPRLCGQGAVLLHTGRALHPRGRRYPEPQRRHDRRRHLPAHHAGGR